PLLLHSARCPSATGGGLQVTGTPTPPQDNGFKSLRGKSTIYSQEIQALRERVAARDFVAGRGTREERDVVRPYLDHAGSSLRLGARRPKVVVDAGNGTGGGAGGPRDPQRRRDRGARSARSG